MIRIRSHRRIIGRAHVDRRILDRTWIRTEDRIELGVVVMREPHVVVHQARRATTHRKQQHETRETCVGSADLACGFLGAGVVEQLPVHQAGIGIGHDDVRTQVLALGYHPGDSRGISRDGRDVHARAYVHSALQASPMQRLCQRAEPAS